MEIRLYRETDRPQLVALWKTAFPDDPPHNEPAKVIDAKLKVDDLIFVATEQDRIIGAAIAGYDGHRGWLYAVAVDATMRRNGVGSTLVHHIVTALSSLGCIKINLQVRSSNSAVVSFYESLGFKVEDRISMGLLLAGDTMTRFKAVYPISNEDMNALPVKEIGPAIAFYRTVLGFSVVASDSTSAVLKRDDVQIGLIRKADHDPLQAGSCYFAVSDVEALRRELEGKGAKPGATEIQEHDGKDYRLFFVRECDMMESHDGYCFCFGQPA